MAFVLSNRRWFRPAILGLFLFSLAVGAGAKAADDDDSDDDDSMSLADKAAERFPQPVRIGALLHRTVLEPLESQPILGHVDRIVRLSDGSIKVVVRYGGFLGFGTKPIAVPVEAMVLLGTIWKSSISRPTSSAAFRPSTGPGRSRSHPTR